MTVTLFNIYSNTILGIGRAGIIRINTRAVRVGRVVLRSTDSITAIFAGGILGDNDILVAAIIHGFYNITPKDAVDT